MCPEQKNKHGESSMKRLRIAVASNVRYPITFEVLSPAPLSFSLSLSYGKKAKGNGKAKANKHANKPSRVPVAVGFYGHHQKGSVP